MLASISFNQSHKSNLAHNNRENIHGNPGIDQTRLDENIYFVQKDIREVYKDVFQKAVDSYNAKQSRKDRRIEDYYEKIRKDSKTHEQRELIVAIGEGKDGEEYRALKKSALVQYAEEFQERNPNLAVYNMVLHDDEANPHLHINYVPNFESKRGLTRRVGMDKALQQQGIKGKGTELIKHWRERETARIEELAKAHIPSFERVNVGSHKYMKVPQYKEYVENLEVTKERLEQISTKKNSVQAELKKMEKNLEELKSSRIEIPKIETKKSILGNKVVIDSKEFNQLQDTIKKVADLPVLLQRNEQKIQDQNYQIRYWREELSKEKTRNRELNNINQNLKKEIKTLKKEVNRLKQVIERTKERLAQFIDKLKEVTKYSFKFTSKDFANSIVEHAEREVEKQEKVKVRDSGHDLER